MHVGPATEHAAVVDHELRVHGLAGLRVIDASIMPTLVGGFTNVPSIMIGEKGADMIKTAGGGSSGGSCTDGCVYLTQASEEGNRPKNAQRTWAE